MRRLLILLLVVALFSGCDYAFFTGGELTVTFGAEPAVELRKRKPRVHLYHPEKDIRFDESMAVNAAGDAASVTVPYLKAGDWTVWISLEGEGWESDSQTFSIKEKSLTSASGALGFDGTSFSFLWEVGGDTTGVPAISLTRGAAYYVEGRDYSSGESWESRTTTSFQGDFAALRSFSVHYPDGMVFDSAGKDLFQIEYSLAGSAGLKIHRSFYPGMGMISAYLRDGGGYTLSWTQDFQVNSDNLLRIKPVDPDNDGMFAGPSPIWTLEGPLENAAGQLIILFDENSFNLHEIRWIPAPLAAGQTYMPTPALGTAVTYLLYIAVVDAPLDGAALAADLTALFALPMDSDEILNNLPDLAAGYVLSGEILTYVGYAKNRFFSP